MSMDFIKFLPHALIIAVLGGLMNFLDQNFSMLYTWIGFAGWASYFFNGGTVKGGAEVVTCWTGGVIASVIIVHFGTYLTATTGSSLIGFPLAVFCIAFCIILFEKVPGMHVIPAWFIGSACFFGLHSGDYTVSVPGVLVSCVVGQIFGYVSILVRTAYGNAIAET